ncbi:MAG TPA: acyl-CoA dehydrogenase family protein [Nocardioides sp.]|nr:acyl-CoA dehydrogenase family protein [Nocardioides sp.]
MELDAFRKGLDDWLEQEHEALAPPFAGPGTLDEQMEQLNKVKRLVWEADWGRWGWPESIGGLGGSTLLRAYLGEALTARDLVEAGLFSMNETLVPTMIDYAPAELAADFAHRQLSGAETWCQGFSEPSTGSNLSSLTCRATPVDGGYRVSGQKVWTSLAQFSQRCVLLTRTGTQESAHRGITALFVDMDSPGISVRPIETMHGYLEFCEVFYDDVLVPSSRLLGEENGGWAVAMDLLPFERSTALWHRGALMHRRLDQLLASGAEIDARDLGAIAQQLWAFRARSRGTQYRMARGEKLSSETSIDKVLLASTEQALFELAAESLADQVVLGDGPHDEHWRSEFLYSRAATIYGGSAEIQRNIIARRLLDLGDER